MILESIPKDSRAYKEELFGPVFSLFKVHSDMEAVMLANESEYGLSGSIYTKDEERGKDLARMLECGTVFINDVVGSDSRLPSGGFKDSGYGRECYKDGLFESINRKTIVIPK